MTSSLSRSKGRFPQRFAADSPEPGVFRSRMICTRGSTAADVDGAAGLQQDGSTGVGEPGHEREDVGLQERLASGDLNQAVAEREGAVEDLADGQGFALKKGVRRVAVAATEEAGGEPDEDAGEPDEGALALKAPVNLMDDQGSGRLTLQRFEPLRAGRGGVDRGHLGVGHGRGHPSGGASHAGRFSAFNSRLIRVTSALRKSISRNGSAEIRWKADTARGVDQEGRVERAGPRNRRRRGRS